jgi:uncharacterized protein involved in exopolysaccharide biosynthesis
VGLTEDQSEKAFGWRNEVDRVDLMKLPAILLRRWYVIVLVVAAAVGGLEARIVRTPVTYEAQVTIQITAPQLDDIQVLAAGNRSSSILRDDLLLVRNDFDVIVKSSVVRDRTIRQLNLQAPDTGYQVTTAQILDSNYLTLVVRASTPALAQSIVNSHANQAIQYYGELRAKPAAATADFLDSQVVAARAAITSLQKAAAGATGSSSPELQQALANYQILLQKHSDALLIAQDAARVSYIQVAEPAVASTSPSWLKTFGTEIGLTVVGSLGLALFLILLIESLFPERVAVKPSVESLPNRRLETGTTAR